MDFAISEKMATLTARARAFLAAEVTPLERGLAEKGFFAIEPALRAARGKVKEAGMWAPQLPVELGGLGLTLLEHGLMSEALGRSPLGHYVFGCQAPDAGNMEILHLFGTDEQKRRWLEPLAAGEIRSCFSMTEPDSPGSNPTKLDTRARREGGDYVIDGRKWFTSSAQGSAFAVVMAVTDPDAPPHKRASMIIVPTDTPGFRLVRNISIMGHPGEGHQSHAEVTYEGCRVPVENRLGAEGAGFAIAQERLGPGRIHHCMRWLGICNRAFELMVQRAGSRRIDDELLAQKGIVQAWIAECRAKIAAARLLTLETAWKIDRGGFKAAVEEVSLIKFFVAEALGEVLDRAIQVHGGMGVTDDTPLAFFYAHERAARIYDGPDEVHKVSAARRIVKRILRPMKPDEPRPPRAEETLDLEKLAPYLRRVLDAPGAEVTVLQFPGGHSNLTYLVTVGGRELVLRRPPFGSRVKTAHDMSRENRILEKLSPVYPRAPRPVHFCDDESVLGARFYLMERVRGAVLRKGATLNPDTARRLSEALVNALVELHALDWQALGLGDLGHPEGYVARQVSGWSKRYVNAQTDELPDMTAVAAWLAAHQPPSPPATVIHNDFKYDNLVLDLDDPARIVGVLDWEMATVGNPLMDLGTVLCYWTEAGDPPDVRAFAFGPTTAPGTLTRRELAERYAAQSGRDLSHLRFYHCFGLFKTAVVAQQIYYRWKKGLTHDERFGMFGAAVAALARQAASLSDGSSG